MESILKCIFRWEKGILGKCLPKVMQRACDKAGICTKVFQNPKPMFSPLYPTSPTPTRTWKTDGNGGKKSLDRPHFSKKKKKTMCREFKRKITFGVWLGQISFMSMFCLWFIKYPTWKDLKSICVSGERTWKELKEVGIVQTHRTLRLLSRICERWQPHPVYVGSSSSCSQMRKIFCLFPSPLPDPIHFSPIRVIISYCEAKIIIPLPQIPSSWP